MTNLEPERLAAVSEGGRGMLDVVDADQRRGAALGEATRGLAPVRAGKAALVRPLPAQQKGEHALQQRLLSRGVLAARAHDLDRGRERLGEPGRLRRVRGEERAQAITTNLIGINSGSVVQDHARLEGDV